MELGLYSFEPPFDHAQHSYCILSASIRKS